MSKSAVLSRGESEDVLIVAMSYGFVCVECSLCKHAGSSLLCTRAAEMREHLALHRAKGHRVPLEAVDAMGRGWENRAESGG